MSKVRRWLGSRWRANDLRRNKGGEVTERPTITDLPAGWKFPPGSVEFSRDAVNQYNAAVGKGGEVATPDGEIAPAGAVVTLCNGVCLENVILPPRTLHIGQDVEILGAIPIGTTLDVRAEIHSSQEHRGVRIVAIDMFASTAFEGAERFVGRATLMIPVTDEEA